MCTLASDLWTFIIPLLPMKRLKLRVVIKYFSQGNTTRRRQRRDLRDLNQMCLSRVQVSIMCTTMTCKTERRKVTAIAFMLIFAGTLRRYTLCFQCTHTHLIQHQIVSIFTCKGLSSFHFSPVPVLITLVQNALVISSNNCFGFLKEQPVFTLTPSSSLSTL